MRLLLRVGFVVIGLMISGFAFGGSGYGFDLNATDSVTCGWCNEYQFSNNEWIHGFNDTEGDLCGFPNPFSGMPGNTYCARCGGTSTCHVNLGSGEGRCHLACGGSALAPFAPKIEESIKSLDVEALLAQLRMLTEDHDVVIEMVASAGRLDVMAACDRVLPSLSFVVPAELRDSLEEGLALIQKRVV